MKRKLSIAALTISFIYYLVCMCASAGYLKTYLDFHLETEAKLDVVPVALWSVLIAMSFLCFILTLYCFPIFVRGKLDEKYQKNKLLIIFMTIANVIMILFFSATSIAYPRWISATLGVPVFDTVLQVVDQFYQFWTAGFIISCIALSVSAIFLILEYIWNNEKIEKQKEVKETEQQKEEKEEIHK